MPPAAAEAIFLSYQIFPQLKKEREKIRELVETFQKAAIPFKILKSETPIQVVIIPGNEEVKKVAATLQENNFDIRPILYPTVPKGQERLRIVLHSFNTYEEVQKVKEILGSKN